MLLSIRDYAKSRFISYEAARRQVMRYKKELKGKIEIKQRTQYLTEDAIEFLDEHRKYSPVVVHKDKERQEKEVQKNELEELRQENKMLLLKVNELQERIMQEKDNVARIQAEQIKYLEANSRKWWQFGKK
jgi:uncharacterized small protein (DUF1192 family)